MPRGHGQYLRKIVDEKGMREENLRTPQSIDCSAIAARTSSSERQTVDVCAVAAAAAECAADDAALTVTPAAAAVGAPASRACSVGTRAAPRCGPSACSRCTARPSCLRTCGGGRAGRSRAELDRSRLEQRSETCACSCSGERSAAQRSAAQRSAAQRECTPDAVELDRGRAEGEQLVVCAVRVPV